MTKTATESKYRTAAFVHRHIGDRDLCIYRDAADVVVEYEPTSITRIYCGWCKERHTVWENALFHGRTAQRVLIEEAK